MNHKQCPNYKECDCEEIIQLEASQCNHLAKKLLDKDRQIAALMATINYLESRLAKNPPPAVPSIQECLGGIESGVERGT